MSSAGEGNTEYLHGAEASEQARLEAQAEMLGGAEFLPPLKPEMHVVEVGCGTGAIARKGMTWCSSPSMRALDARPGMPAHFAVCELTPGGYHASGTAARMGSRACTAATGRHGSGCSNTHPDVGARLPWPHTLLTALNN